MKNNLFARFEGDTGVASLNKLCEDIGYKGHPFKYGTPLESFLSDNPGAMAAIVDWIRASGLLEEDEDEGVGLEDEDEDEDEVDNEN